MSGKRTCKEKKGREALYAADRWSNRESTCEKKGCETDGGEDGDDVRPS